MMSKSFIIKPGMTVFQVQERFTTMFPFLKLEFFRHRHENKGGSKKRDMLTGDKHNLKLNGEHSLQVNGDLLVSSLESRFSEYYGMNVQVFRKSGKSWLETTLTDDWSLSKQNEEGRELSSYLH